VTSSIAYSSALLAQEHAAYTDYLFSSGAAREGNPRPGEPLSKDEWLQEYYWPRLAYSAYYIEKRSKSKAKEPIIAFEEWVSTEYPKLRFKGHPGHFHKKKE